MKALTFSRFGDSDVLDYTDVPDPIPGPGEVLVQMQTIGLNYADIYRRKGNYHLKGSPPYIAGYEGAGIIIDSNHQPAVNVGNRVAFADVPFAHAELVVVPTSHLIPLPDNISCQLAASVLLQGMTAQYLALDSHLVKQNELVLIHAASGGVGQLLTQICKLQKAIVIGLTTSEAKKGIIRETGADAVFNLGDDWKAAVMAFTHGKGVDVVYDSVGSTLANSLEITRTGGQVVFYGMSGGNPSPIDPRLLMDGSKTLTGGDLWSYLTSKEERLRRSSQLFDWIRTNQLQVRDPVKFKLSEGKLAHDFLETGRSAGKVVLVTNGAK